MLLSNFFLTYAVVLIDVFGKTLSVKQINKPGFGDPHNAYAWSMEVFQGSIYVGTLNAINMTKSLGEFCDGLPFKTNGTQVWKGNIINNEWTWNKVLSSGNGLHWNYGIRKLRTVGQYLYGVTANHVTGFELWRTNDGINWEIIIKNGFGERENLSGRGLISYKGYLYIGIENYITGAKILRRELQSDGNFVINSEWEYVTKNGFAQRNNYWVSGFAIYMNYLYIGLLNMNYGYELYRTFDGINYEMLLTKGNGNSFEEAIMTLIVYNSKLYFGTMNLYNGTSLYVNNDTQGKQFIPLFIDGNNDIYNMYTWSMSEYNNRLYIGTSNPYGFQFFSSDNPINNTWIYETYNGYNDISQVGIRTMSVYQNKLIFGTASIIDSCLIYQGSDETHI